jgi:hypothetical protein
MKDFASMLPSIETAIDGGDSPEALLRMSIILSTMARIERSGEAISLGRYPDVAITLRALAGMLDQLHDMER